MSYSAVDFENALDLAFCSEPRPRVGESRGRASSTTRRSKALLEPLTPSEPGLTPALSPTLEAPLIMPLAGGAGAPPPSPPAPPPPPPGNSSPRRPTKRGPAKIFGETELNRVLAYIDFHSRERESDRAKLLLSYRAGLRPCEISGLLRSTLVTATGELEERLVVMPASAKRGKGRTIAMHPQLRAALLEVLEAHPEAKRIAFFHRRGELAYQSPTVVMNWFANLYRKVGLRGCTGMSGRRSFASGLMKRGASPADVQRLLGHASLQTTSLYIEPSGDCAELIQSMGRTS